MRNDPIVSVVMCTYNAEKYIKDAIESVLSQTFTNFEFIIWDDGSTDLTRTIVDSYKDERIRYIYHKNTGLGMALKLACAEARGQYIARMDSDDVCMPDRLIKEIEFLEKHQEFVLVSSAVLFIDAEGNIIGQSFPITSEKVLKAQPSRICHPMVMMRKTAYFEAGGYVPIRYCEDDVFWRRLSRYGKFHNLLEPLGKYRMLSTSLGHEKGPYEQVLYAFRQKMANDDVVVQEDIQIYNECYLRGKRIMQEQSLSISSKQHFSKQSLDLYAYRCLKSFIGEKMARGVISSIKNLFSSAKLLVRLN